MTVWIVASVHNELLLTMDQLSHVEAAWFDSPHLYLMFLIKIVNHYYVTFKSFCSTRKKILKQYIFYIASFPVDLLFYFDNQQCVVWLFFYCYDMKNYLNDEKWPRKFNIKKKEISLKIN